MGRMISWITGLALWALFTFWYTNTGGPLKQEEIDHYLELMAQQNDADPAQLRAFLEQDSGNQFIMVNIIDLNENPPPVPGAAPGEDAKSLMARYMEYMFPALLSRACHPIYAGRAVGPALDLVGLSGAYEWDQAAMMRYRSKRDMLEIATNPEFTGRHDFKIAALDKTVAFPVEGVLYYSDPRFLLALILFSLCALINLILPRK